MGFFESIEKIQQKSDREKKKLLAVSVCMLMILIIMVWLSLPDTKKQAVSETAVSQKQTAGPLDMLWNGIKNIIK